MAHHRLIISMDDDLDIWLRYFNDGVQVLCLLLSDQEVAAIQQALGEARRRRDDKITEGLERILSEGV